MFFAKNWQESKEHNVKIQKSGAEVCPSPALSRVFVFTSVPVTCGFPHKKIPRREGTVRIKQLTGTAVFAVPVLAGVHFS